MNQSLAAHPSDECFDHCDGGNDGFSLQVAGLNLLNMSRHARFALEVATLAVILALASYLRLVNVATNPGWYTDEGTHLDIAENLLGGRVQYLAITQSTLLFAKLPLFDLFLAGLLRLGADRMLTLRTLTGGLNVVSVALLYALVRRAGQSSTLALTSALTLAVYPQAVLYSRFGFSYNLLTLWTLLASLGLWSYLDSARRRWLALSFLSIGLGAVSDLWMLVLVVPAMLIVSLRRWRDIVWGLLLLVLPLGVYIAAMLLSAPRAFLFDLHYTLSRLSALSPVEQIANISLNYTMLLAQDVWMGPALIGLMMLRPARLQRLCLLMSLFPLVALGRTVALFSLSAYYTIPLLPFVALGVASLVWHGTPRVFQIARDSLAAVLSRWQPDRTARPSILLNAIASLSLLIILFPLWAGLTGTIKAVWKAFITPIDPFLINASDAQEIASFVNTHTYAEDVVIASPAVAWLVEARAADFQMAIAASGQATAHLPGDIPIDRFAFDPRFNQARYVVVDNLWRGWGAVHVPGLSQVLSDLESWKPVFTAGEIVVYQNPALSSR